MKHLAAVLLGLILNFSASAIYAQTNITNDYIIVSSSEVLDTKPYTDALDAANWENFRLQNMRRTLAFENGFTIELKSAVELLNLGYPVNLNNYPTSLPDDYVAPTLELLAGNVIGMKIHTKPSKSVHKN